MSILKDTQLQNLERDIKRDIPNHWLFPTENAVQGFMGTGGKHSVMFIGERPSSAERGINSYRKKFYQVLQQFNLQDSHLTDLIKSRGKVKDAYPDLQNDWRFFKRELAIIEPKVVFTLSDRVHNFLLFYLIEKKITEVPIYHYSYAFRYNKIKEFSKQIEKGLKLI